MLPGTRRALLGRAMAPLLLREIVAAERSEWMLGVSNAATERLWRYEGR